MLSLNLRSSCTQRPIRALGWICLLSLPFLLSACGGDDDSSPPSHAYHATLRYTAYGAPHIEAVDFKGAGYAYGYAFAKDNVCLYSEELVTLRGERSRYFGEAGTYFGQLFGETLNNVDSDFFYKLLFTESLVEQQKTRLSQDAQDITSGFVAGYNRYLREAGSSGLPEECRDEAWVQPMTEQDAYWRYMQLAMIGSSISFINEIGSAQPPLAASVARSVRAEGLADATDAWSNSQALKRIAHFRERSIGSNSYGFGRDVTESGKGLVMGSLHFPWWGSLRLHQVHMRVTSRDYDVYGATLLGVPLPLVGFNDQIAWMHTFSTDNRFTLRMLSLDPANPKRYIKDGVSIPLSVMPLKITAKAANGALREISRTLYMSEYGPLLTDPEGGLVWNSQIAFAIQDANLANYKIIDQVILNGLASDVAGLRVAGATHSAMPWANTIAADRKGDVLYGNFSVAANVHDLQLAAGACVPGQEQGLPFFDLMNTLGTVVMTGATSQCDWSGYIDGSLRPWVIRSDYVLNANDSHWWPNLQIFLAGYPKIIATGPYAEGQVQGERTRAGHAIVRDRLSGADGLAGSQFTLANLQEIFLQARFFHAEEWLPDFTAACLTSPTASEAARDACAVLDGWEKKHGLTHSGAILFQEFYAKLGRLVDPKWWAIPYSVSDPLETPKGAASIAEAMALLEQLVADPQFNSPQKRRVRPADVQILLRDGRPLSIPGGAYTFNNWNGQKMLDPFGSGNYIYTADPSTNLGAYGNSYIQFVTWDNAGPIAEGLLTYGQSAHPSSPHFSDQTKRYATGEWVKLPYTEAQISAELTGGPIVLSE